MLLAIIFVLGAAWSFFIAARPEVGFFLEEGWKFRDAEPSDLYLGVTRFGAAVTGIACLVFAAILAFGGLDGSESGSGGSSPTTEQSTDPFAEGLQRAQEKEEEASQRAREECQRLKPKFEQAVKWNAQDKVANPDALHSLAGAEGATVEFEPRANGEVVTVRGSEAEFAGAPGRVLFFMTPEGATCMP